MVAKHREGLAIMRDNSSGNTSMKSTSDNASARRTRELVARGDACIEVIAEGAGLLFVLLPSRGRDSEDYDEVAAGIAEAGFRVLRPQPRGAGRSSGPMHGLTLHDFAREVAALDPFRPRAAMNEIRDEFGERVTIVVIPDASHALIPEQPAAVIAAIVVWMRRLPQ
jgi:pimeloyl-ACP methyl ester carboxylesterase